MQYRLFKIFKNMLLLSVSSLFLVACGNNEDTGMQNEPTEENIESPAPDENQNTEDDQENEADVNENQDQTNGSSGEDEGELSEVVYMSGEERLAHHQELAVEPEQLSSEVYEQLLLPGIHENTKIYEGRVNPGDSLLFEIPDAEEIADRTTLRPDVSEDGYFVVELNNYEVEADQSIRIYITGSYAHEQTFDLPIHEAQEGMEEVRVSEVSGDDVSFEHIIEGSDTLASIAAQYDVSAEELQKWNGILDPAEIELGTTISVDGPNEEQAQKEDWQLEFEQTLYNNYGVTVREYEDIGDGYYGVYVNEHDIGNQYYVTVDSETGDFHG